MKYTAECFDLGFICESVFEGENRNAVHDEVLAHLDEIHRTGSSSTGLKDFVGRHINQVDDDAVTEAESGHPGNRRGPRGSAHPNTWIADRFGRRGSQAHHDEEPTP